MGSVTFARMLRLAGLLMFLAVAPFADAHSSVFAQGNTVSGFVWGPGRVPVPDVNVELQNDLYVTIQRTRTSSSGNYRFDNVPSGRLRVRVLPSGLDFEQQEVDLEIVNFTRDNGAGGVRRSGFSNEQHNIFLRLKKGADPAAVGVLFAQEVPEEAKKLYSKAVDDLANTREKEGLEGLRSAIEAFPKYFLALDRLGNEYVRLKHFGAAEVLLSVASDINPKSFRTWYGLAYARHSLGLFPDAIAAAEKALALDAGNANSLYVLGSSQRHLKKYEAAEKTLAKAKDLPGYSPLVHWELALLYGNNLKRYGAAANELKAFLKAQPETKDAELIKQLITDFESKDTASAAKSNQ